MQQKVQFIWRCCTIPTADPRRAVQRARSGQRAVMKDVVVEAARGGRTVLFSTHIMEAAERMCDQS